MDGLLHLFVRRPFMHVVRDILDIAIVAFVFYRMLVVLRGTRAQQMGIGLLMISGLYAVAKYTDFLTVLNLLNAVLPSIGLIVVVVFQNDIRRALIRVGDKAWLPGFARAQETRAVEEVVTAVTELARHRVGALITFEQDANLEEFVVGHGIAIDAAVSRELLVSIFLVYPDGKERNKLHDGAVILRNFRIASAGVFFPMPEARNLDPSLGSRHRAALGITEETDAVVVVVSEERGTITICFRGTLIQNLDGQTLRSALLDLFGHKPRNKKKAPVAAPSKERSPDTKQDTLQGGSAAVKASSAAPRPGAAASAISSMTTPLPVLGLASSEAPTTPTGALPSPSLREREEQP